MSYHAKKLQIKTQIENSETIIDQFSRAYFPGWYQRRLESRIKSATAYSALGMNFEASNRKRKQSAWITTNHDADTAIQHELEIIRDRCLDLDRSSPLATGAVGTYATHVAGRGLKLQSRINAEILGMTQEQADEWQDKVEYLYDCWASQKTCDQTEERNFYQLQYHALLNAATSGDCFAVLNNADDDRQIIGLKIHLVEAHMVGNPSWRQDSDLEIKGIRKDATGKATHVHIYDKHPGRFLMNTYNQSRTGQWYPIYGTRSGLKRILQIGQKRRIGQTRAMPFLTPVVDAIKQLSTYSDAEIQAAVSQAFWSIFIKTESGDGLGQTQTDYADTTTAENENNEYKISAGSIIEGMPGDEAQMLAPTRPNTNFSPFIQAVLQQIGCALQIPFEIIIKFFHSSYTAARGALLEGEKFFTLERENLLVSDFCQPIYELWLYNAVSTGLISAPGFFRNALIRYAWCGSTWEGDGMISLNPVQEQLADERFNNMGVLPLEAVSSKIGRDFRKDVKTVIRERKFLNDSGFFIKKEEPQNSDDNSRMNQRDEENAEMIELEQVAA